MAPESTTQSAAPVDDETEYSYEPAEAPAPDVPQVSSVIAIIRIIAVLAMGLCLSFGIFLMLFGGKGLLIGGVLVVLAIPCYFGMQLAERLASSPPRSSGPA